MCFRDFFFLYDWRMLPSNLLFVNILWFISYQYKVQERNHYSVSSWSPSPWDFNVTFVIFFVFDFIYLCLKLCITKFIFVIWNLKYFMIFSFIMFMLMLIQLDCCRMARLRMRNLTLDHFLFWWWVSKTTLR